MAQTIDVDRPHRILLVDDEPSILTFLQIGLEHEGYDVAIAVDGTTALQQFHQFSPQLVVLDLMLPDLDGAEVCQQIRTISRVPILMLTARNTVEDRVRGLGVGADDYVGKPVRLKELLARIRSLLRRAPGKMLQARGLELDVARRQVVRADRRIDLTQRECELLELLMQRAGQVVTRQQILKQIWGFDYIGGQTNVVEVHVRALRIKLGDAERKLIRSIRGVGYALRR